MTHDDRRVIDWTSDEAWEGIDHVERRYHDDNSQAEALRRWDERHEAGERGCRHWLLALLALACAWAAGGVR